MRIRTSVSATLLKACGLAAAVWIMFVGLFFSSRPLTGNNRLGDWLIDKYGSGIEITFLLVLVIACAIFFRYFNLLRVTSIEILKDSLIFNYVKEPPVSFGIDDLQFVERWESHARFQRFVFQFKQDNIVAVFDRKKAESVDKCLKKRGVKIENKWEE